MKHSDRKIGLKRHQRQMLLIYQVKQRWWRQCPECNGPDLEYLNNWHTGRTWTFHVERPAVTTGTRTINLHPERKAFHTLPPCDPLSLHIEAKIKPITSFVTIFFFPLGGIKVQHNLPWKINYLRKNKWVGWVSVPVVMFRRVLLWCWCDAFVCPHV